MDDSTDGVTLYAGFIFDVLWCFEGSRQPWVRELREMASGLDPERPAAPVSIQLYNDMCAKVERNLGPANLRKVGAAIGERAYGQMLAGGSLGEEPTPLEILRELKRVASLMIQDRKGRGWEILEAGPNSVLMRRTQSFNCLLQEGLLSSLVKKTGVSWVGVDHLSCTRRGDEFCDYRVKWQ